MHQISIPIYTYMFISTAAENYYDNFFIKRFSLSHATVTTQTTLMRMAVTVSKNVVGEKEEFRRTICTVIDTLLVYLPS